MRTLPPRRPKGSPRPAGSGRKRGTPNKRTVEMKTLLSSLCHDISYQCKLREDFKRRRLHPAIESLAWAHTIGKPVDRVQVAADVTMHKQLEQERALFARLSPEQLQELADDNQRLLDKARRMVRQLGPPADATGVRRSDAG